MKRFVLIFLASFLFAFLLSSCGVSSQKQGKSEDVLLPDYIESREMSKDYTDENGRAVYSLKFTYPYFNSSAPSSLAAAANEDIEKALNEEISYAENNISYAADYLDSNSTDVAWKTNIGYEFYLCDENYISFALLTQKSVTDANVPPSYSGFNYEIASGYRLGFNSIKKEGESYESVKKSVRLKLVDILKDSTSANVKDEDVDKMLEGIFNIDSFVLTKQGRKFFIPVSGYGLGLYGYIQVDI